MKEPKDVRAILTATGLPVAYRMWEEGKIARPALLRILRRPSEQHGRRRSGVLQRTAVHHRAIHRRKRAGDRSPGGSGR